MHHEYITDTKLFLLGTSYGFAKWLLNINFSVGFWSHLAEGCITALAVGLFSVAGKYLAVWIKTKGWPWVCGKLSFKKQYSDGEDNAQH